MGKPEEVGRARAAFWLSTAVPDLEKDLRPWRSASLPPTPAQGASLKANLVTGPDKPLPAIEPPVKTANKEGP